MWQKLVEEDPKTIQKIGLKFWTNLEYNYTPLFPRLKKQCRFKVKLNNYWKNLHKN